MDPVGSTAPSCPQNDPTGHVSPVICMISVEISCQNLDGLFILGTLPNAIKSFTASPSTSFPQTALKQHLHSSRPVKIQVHPEELCLNFRRLTRRRLGSASCRPRHSGPIFSIRAACLALMNHGNKAGRAKTAHIKFRVRLKRFLQINAAIAAHFVARKILDGGAFMARPPKLPLSGLRLQELSMA